MYKRAGIVLGAALMCLLPFSCRQEGRLQQTPAGISGEPAEELEVRKKYKEGQLVMEATFKGEVRHGLTRTYYFPGGELNKQIWYENGVKSDTATWHYTSGAVYRATPYVQGVIHGIQQKYYKDGMLMARIPYYYGLRKQGMEEFNPNGSQRTGKPSIQYTFREFPDRDVVLMDLSLSSRDRFAEFYIGSLKDGVFDPSITTKVSINNGKRSVVLKDGSPPIHSIPVIAVFRTAMRNIQILDMRIEIPYENKKIDS